MPPAARDPQLTTELPQVKRLLWHHEPWPFLLHQLHPVTQGLLLLFDPAQKGMMFT